MISFDYLFFSLIFILSQRKAFDSTSLHSILFCFKHFNVLQGPLRMGTPSITALSPNAILNQKLRSKNEHSHVNLVFSLRWKNSYRLSHLNARCHHCWFIAKLLFFYREQQNKKIITENNIAEIFSEPHTIVSVERMLMETLWKPDGSNCRGVARLGKWMARSEIIPIERLNAFKHSIRINHKCVYQVKASEHVD